MDLWAGLAEPPRCFGYAGSMRTAVIFVCVCVLLAAAQAPFDVLGDFQPGWDSAWHTEQLGGRETRYWVVRDGDEWVLRADSDAAATALFRRLELSGGSTQNSWRQISWRWKVDHSLAGEFDETQREGDDYAARLFVIFGKGEFNRDTRVLCYVWAADKAVGSSYRSPYVGPPPACRRWSCRAATSAAAGRLPGMTTS